MLRSPISKTVEVPYLKRKLKTCKIYEQRNNCIGSIKAGSYFKVGPSMRKGIGPVEAQESELC